MNPVIPALGRAFCVGLCLGIPRAMESYRKEAPLLLLQAAVAAVALRAIAWYIGLGAALAAGFCMAVTEFATSRNGVETKERMIMMIPAMLFGGAIGYTATSLFS